MRIFLPHGMGRTPMSMWPLALRLRRAGHRPSLFGYTVTFEPLHRIAARYLRHVRHVLAEDQEQGLDIEQWGVVGHSLGNVITRMASPELPAGFARFAMLAPPNRMPASARRLRKNPIYRWFTRDTGQQLADPSFFEQLPQPDVPMLVIAGAGGPSFDFLPFDGPNDAVVQVSEAEIDGVPLLVLPAVHTFLMNRRDVFEALRDFVDHGDGARIVGERGSAAGSSEADVA